MQISVSIINPNPIAGEGLRRIIHDDGLEVAQVGASVDDIALAGGANTRLILVDLPNPAAQVSAVGALVARDDEAKCLVLAEKLDYAAMVACFEQGAHGYVIKNVPCSTLTALLRLACLGHKILPPDLADMLRRDEVLVSEPSGESEVSIGSAQLSRREYDVLCCLMAGYPNKLIARKLDVSEATIKVHVKAILRKLNVMNRTQAAIWATSRGIGGTELRAS